MLGTQTKETKSSEETLSSKDDTSSDSETAVKEVISNIRLNTSNSCSVKCKRVIRVKPPNTKKQMLSELTLSDDEDPGEYRKGKWLKKEEDILKRNAREYLEMNNVTLEHVMSLGRKEARPFFQHCALDINRPYTSIWRKCMRMFDHRNKLGHYTEQEIKQIAKIVGNESSEKKWKMIGDKIGRSAGSVRDRVTKIGTKVSNRTKKAWTASERERLSEGVLKFGQDWVKISEHVKTRSKRQCYNRHQLETRREEGGRLSTLEHVILVELLNRKPLNYIQDIDWLEVVEEWPEKKRPDINSANLRKRFLSNVNYRVPFNSELTFNDVMDVLMENFVRPFREKEKAIQNKENKSESEVTKQSSPAKKKVGRKKKVKSRAGRPRNIVQENTRDSTTSSDDESVIEVSPKKIKTEDFQ